MIAFIRRIFVVREKDNAEFWVGQMLVIAATVLGVYLAAQAGFRAALDFEILRLDRESYYLRAAMRDELEDNAARIEGWVADFQAGKAAQYRGRDAEPLRLDTFVWEAMGEAPATFEIPAPILTGVRRYYAESTRHLDGLTAPGNAWNADAEALAAATATLRADILPALDANIEGLRERLEDEDFLAPPIGN